MIETDLPDEKAFSLSDFFSTGYMVAENGRFSLENTGAVWGWGPGRQFVIASVFILSAARVIAIDRLPERLEMARSIDVITVDALMGIVVLTAPKDQNWYVGSDPGVSIVISIRVESPFCHVCDFLTKLTVIENESFPRRSQYAPISLRFSVQRKTCHPVVE